MAFKALRPNVVYVYILHSERLQRYYVGSTEDVQRRLQEHNAGKSHSTRGGVPWELVRVEEFGTRAEAMRQEHRIKGRGIGRYLSEMMDG